jgi:hypothetical protein
MKVNVFQKGDFDEMIMEGPSSEMIKEIEAKKQEGWETYGTPLEYPNNVVSRVMRKKH